MSNSSESTSASSSTTSSSLHTSSQLRKQRDKNATLISFIVELISCHILSIWKRMSKVVLHYLTGWCELERICYKEKIESIRIRRIESSLQSSKSICLRNAIKYSFEQQSESEEDVALKIMHAKNIPRDPNLNFLILMKDGLLKINAYNKLISDVERIRHKKFSFDDAENCNSIFDLWYGLRGKDDVLDTKISKRWTEIGFQGNDPSTDFRGMGLLGLVNLNYFVSTMNDQARSAYSKSLNPKYGYPFAIVGINVSSWIHKLLLDGHLKTHFFNNSELMSIDRINVEYFNKIYCIIFMEFEKYWFMNEPNIMQFERLTKLFLANITDKLQNDAQTIICDNFAGNKCFLKQIHVRNKWFNFKNKLI